VWGGSKAVLAKGAVLLEVVQTREPGSGNGVLYKAKVNGLNCTERSATQDGAQKIAESVARGLLERALAEINEKETHE
jgi:hypothetical protein